MKKILSVFMMALLVTCCTACGEKDLSKGKIEKISYEETEEVTNFVKIETTKNKIILIELYPDVAPITVENFQNLVKEKFYDGIIFHRVINDFMIQGGDPDGTGIGGSELQIKGEFANNGIENNLSHTRGVISMARTSNDMDSASSQFFIVQADSTYLDGDYAAFGRVIAGMKTVDEIASVATDERDKPTSAQMMRSIRFVKIEK
ncbi:MAG: peptidylprolyl isomerase [Bacilli bacterium]|nr:peptidylprolyl isomerase [Bacilli bacterium]